MDFSVVIPVWKESKQIKNCLLYLEKISKDIAIEVIIVDGESEQTTLTALSDKEEFIFPIYKLPSAPGRGKQMNLGGKQAQGKWLVFLHADTRLPRDAFASILSLNSIDWGAFRLKIDSDKLSFRWIENMANLRSKYFQLPYGDQAFFCLRSVFLQIGMFQEYPLMEDVEFARRVKKQKLKFQLQPSVVKTSARRWQKDGIWRGTSRNIVLLLLYFLGVSPYTLKKYYS
ncbi:MAG: TIGR04283 family arsenosugar biosynthesis glycosyltransferase [Spirochaetota bacterium]